MHDHHGFEPQMIVVRFQQTFPLRVSEWVMAVILVNIGFVLLLNPEIFALPQHSAMARWANVYVWGWGCLLMGAVRFAVLVINGAWRASPHIRAVTAFLACFVWLEILLGLGASGVASIGLAVYPWFLVLDTYNVFRAASDAREADDKARARRGK